MFVYEWRSGLAGGDLLDEREAGSLFGDDEQAPEERAAFGRVRHAHVERLLELDALRDDDEQAVLPDRRVVRGELLVPADERVEALVLLGQRRKGDSLGRPLDLDAGLGDRGETRHVELEHRPGGTCARDCPWNVSEGVGVEVLEVREAPVLLRRAGKGQCAIGLECFGAHQGVESSGYGA